MASKNETVAEIASVTRAIWQGCEHVSLSEYDGEDLLGIIDRIEAAHNRELAAKDDERLTIVANYENVIAAKDREIAELREHIKIAEDALTELQTRLVSSVYDGTMNPYEALEITERAIAAIREEGGAK